MFETKLWLPTPYVFDGRQVSSVACGAPMTTSVVAGPASRPGGVL